MKITSEGTRGEEPRAPLFSFFNSANIGALPGIHFCLSTTSTSVTSARYPPIILPIITYALSLKSFAYAFSCRFPHRHGLDGLPASVQFDADSAHFNSHITRYADGVCRRIPIGLSCKNEEEGSRPDVGKRQKCTCHLTIASHSRRSHISFPTSPVSAPTKLRVSLLVLQKQMRTFVVGDEDERHATIAPFHSLQTTNATLAPQFAQHQHQLKPCNTVNRLLACCARLECD